LAADQIGIFAPRPDWRTYFRQPCRQAERGIWQRRYWEHTIRDANDFARHIDYIHINPVKHDLVTWVRDWPHSSFHRMVKFEVYPEDWAGDVSDRDGAFGELQHEYGAR